MDMTRQGRAEVYRKNSIGSFSSGRNVQFGEEIFRMSGGCGLPEVNRVNIVEIL